MSKIFRWFQQFGKENYSVLLFSLFLIFVLRPHDRTGIYIVVWKFFFVATIIFSVFNVEHTRFLRILVSVLAIPTVFFNWIDLFYDTPTAVLGITISTMVFLAFCAASILKDVVIKARVTLETMRGAICAYFLLAFLFAHFFLFIETVIPGTILVRDEIIPVFPNVFYFLSQMIYFSFSSLLATGYGDIVAAKSIGQTAVVLEIAIGQFYIAILISRLVSIYSLIEDQDMILKLTHHEKTK